jgi:hypothetical protein
MEAFRATDGLGHPHRADMEKRCACATASTACCTRWKARPSACRPAIIQRIKIMSNMKIAEKRVPQDGRIQINVMGRDLDLRVSTVPSNHGESVVMRILDKENLLARPARSSASFRRPGRPSSS